MLENRLKPICQRQIDIFHGYCFISSWPLGKDERDIKQILNTQNQPCFGSRIVLFLRNIQSQSLFRQIWLLLGSYPLVEHESNKDFED